MAQPIACQQLAFTNTNDSYATLSGVQRVMVRTSADVYIDFDQPVATTTSFKLLASNTADTTIELTGGSIQKLHAQGVSGSGTLYIIAIIN